MSEHVFDTARWQAMTLFEQMGNIGSEVGRTMNALRRNDTTSLQGAYYRGLDLIDATVQVLDLPRKRELLRTREEFTAAVEAHRVDSGLEEYFMQYAIAARSGR